MKSTFKLCVSATIISLVAACGGTAQPRPFEVAEDDQETGAGGAGTTTASSGGTGPSTTTSSGSGAGEPCWETDTCPPPECGDGEPVPGELCIATVPVEYELASKKARGLALVDCDGDGALDILATVAGGNDGITALRGLGDGTYPPAMLRHSYAHTKNPADIAVHQTDEELVVATGHMGTISSGGVQLWSQAQSDCVFSATKEKFVASSGRIFGLALTYLNDDPLIDVVAFINNSNHDQIGFVKNGYPLALLASALGNAATTGNGDLIAVDLNNDGFEDAAYTRNMDNEIAWRLHDGQGMGGERPPLASGGGNPIAIAAGDMDGDGDMDLVVANRGSDDVDVFLNQYLEQGEVVFLPAAGSPYSIDFGYTDSVPIQWRPTELAIGDMDNDGVMDVVTVNASSQQMASVSILVGQGDGSLALATAGSDYPEGYWVDEEPEPDYPINVFRTPTGIALGDVNNDGALDIVTSHYSNRVANESPVSVLLSRP